MVKGKRFNDFKDTGDPVSAVKIYSAQDADELVFLNIDRSDISGESFANLCETIKLAAEECFMPLSAGGGIDSLEKASILFQLGADKVVITTASVTDPVIIKQVADKFGTQSVVGGIDYKFVEGERKVFINCGRTKTNLDPLEHAFNLIESGVGEIFLQSIDHDGSMKGYDVDYASSLASIIKVPLVVCGGAGNFADLKLALESKISGAACASLFHFGDNNPIRARSYLKNAAILMRKLR